MVLELIDAKDPDINECEWKKNPDILCVPSSVSENCMLLRQARFQSAHGSAEIDTRNGGCGPYWRTGSWKSYVLRSVEFIPGICPERKLVRQELEGITAAKIRNNELV